MGKAQTKLGGKAVGEQGVWRGRNPGRFNQNTCVCLKIFKHLKIIKWILKVQVFSKGQYLELCPKMLSYIRLSENHVEA